MNKKMSETEKRLLKDKIIKKAKDKWDSMEDGVWSVDKICGFVFEETKKDILEKIEKEFHIVNSNGIYKRMQLSLIKWRKLKEELKK